MPKTVTATEVVRKFSEILNSIKYQGDHYTVLRGGKPIASITPADPHRKPMTLGNLIDIVKALPSLGAEAGAFTKDVEDIIRRQPSMPERGKWA